MGTCHVQEERQESWEDEGNVMESKKKKDGRAREVNAIRKGLSARNRGERAKEYREGRKGVRQGWRRVKKGEERRTGETWRWWRPRKGIVTRGTRKNKRIPRRMKGSQARMKTSRERRRKEGEEMCCCKGKGERRKQDVGKSVKRKRKSEGRKERRV